MATNLKGAGGIKGFLLLHGEKIAIGVIGFLALWIVYKSMSLPRLDDKFQAEALRNEITRTSSDLTGFTWDKAVTDHPDKVKKAQAVAAKTNIEVDHKFYVNNGDQNGRTELIDPPVVAPMILRADPVLLNAVDVIATGGSGPLAFLDEEIRKERALRLAEEAQAQAKKDADKAKKDEALRAKEATGGAPGEGRRNRPGQEGVPEVIDPNHPKRRMIEGQVRPTGIQVQGDERIERASWACVVAKVPIREQLKQYQDSFEKARGYEATRDFPQYLGFYVQRAEVVPGKELEWKRVPLFDAQQKSIAANTPLSNGPNHAIGLPVIEKLYAAAAQFWAAGGGQEIVDERFMEKGLTLPLPPLVGRDFGPEVTHPDIPLNPPPLENEMPQVATQPTDQQPGTKDVNSEFGATNAPMTVPGGPGSFGAGPGGRGPGPGAYGQGGSMPRGMSYGPGPEGGPGGMRIPGGMGSASFARRGEGGMEGGPGAYRGSMGGMGGGGRAAGQHTTLPKGVDYYLLRFFDYTVEPGKKYKYRVQLVMSDPNFGMPANTLSPVVLDRMAKASKASGGQKSSFRVIETRSDPSPTVGIPFSGSVRLADVKLPPPEKFSDEPSIGVQIESFDIDEKGNAIQAAIDEKDFHRGYVANAIKDTEYLGPGYIDFQEKFKFLTGMTVLDVAGGNKMGKDTTPGRLLLMGPAGQMYIRNEVDDKPFIEYHHLLFEKMNDRRRGPGGGPEEGGPGGPGQRRSPAPRAAGRG